CSFTRPSMRDDFLLSRRLRFQRVFLLVLLASVWGILPVLAQQQQAPALPSPRLLTVLPLGAKAGTTVELTVSGNDLQEPQGLLFSVRAITSEAFSGPMPAPADPKKPAPKPGKPAPVVVTTRFKVTVPANTPLGIHDVRVVNKWGISNPRAFVVGDLN